MASSSTVDIIEKLIQLALKNPNREEAASAALKAVTLIDKYSVPLGSEVHITRDAEWKPPDKDFSDLVETILRGAKNPDAPLYGPAADVKGGMMIQDRDVLTREDAFRAQMKRAWQAIREERQKIEGWVHRLTQEHRQSYWADHPRPWGPDKR